MDIATIAALAPVITWVLTEIVGKFLLKKLDKKVLSVLVGVLTLLTMKWAGGDLTVLQTVLGGTAIGPFTGILHDKLIEPLLILSKKEIEDNSD